MEKHILTDYMWKISSLQNNFVTKFAARTCNSVFKCRLLIDTKKIIEVYSRAVYSGVTIKVCPVSQIPLP